MLFVQRKQPTKHCYTTKPTLLRIRGTQMRDRPYHARGQNIRKAIFEEFQHKLDSNHWHANKVFWKTIRRVRGKKISYC